MHSKITLQDVIGNKDQFFFYFKRRKYVNKYIYRSIMRFKEEWLYKVRGYMQVKRERV
jgi:hypothetical protein